MSFVRKHARFAVILCATAVSVSSAALPRVIVQQSVDGSQAKTRQPRIVFSRALRRLDGSHLKATVVEVTYGPGESSPPHSHPCAVIAYILAGALRTQVKGQSEAIYKAGESFFEAPNGVHMISANASDKKPAKFLAYFVCDHDTPLNVAPPEPRSSGGQ